MEVNRKGQLLLLDSDLLDFSETAEQGSLVTPGSGK